MTELRDRLGEAIDRVRRMAPGMPASFDMCALKAAEIHLEAGLPDPAAPHRGQYTTEQEMRRHLGKGGLPAAVRKAARRLGWKRIHASRAQLGDWGLVATPNGPAVVVKDRAGFLQFVAGGYALVPLEAVNPCWNVLGANDAG